MTDPDQREVLAGLADLARRVEERRISEGLSYRDLGKLTGVPFSTLARVARAEGNFSRESERKLRIWMGEPATHITPVDLQRQAEELGRAAARAFQSELQDMLAAAIAASREAGE